ncbi:MAG: beta-galactosidase, partial [Cytophagales bacterium]|nr:beta-galactosidase [Cytophagales bacterium]
LAGKYHLKVVMCTPTATPPAWLTTKYPEILMTNAAGRKVNHGSRQQGSWSSAKYQEYITKIVTQMAQRYGKNPTVWGWQIDNEPSHYWADDYSPVAKESFQRWLSAKYSNIQTLNKAWGADFWSQNYNDFSQIVIPNNFELAAQSNPHAMLDFKRFQAQECAAFVQHQNKLLKKYISPSQWVTTNYIYFCDQVDPSLSKDLDFVSFTIYPAGGIDMGVGEQGFRTGNAERIAFANDYFRNITGTTGCMEIQPGQVNWGPKFNPLLPPGTVRMWLWHLFAGGNKFVCSYRFRQPLFGIEQYHHGMMQTDGVTLSQGGKEYAQFIQEIKELRTKYSPTSKEPADYGKRKTAMILNFDNLWETDNQKQNSQWSYSNHFFKYEMLLKKMGAPVDIISESADYSKYPFLIAPAYQLLDNTLVTKWETYVKNGGHLILTCRTGQKDRNAHLWQAEYSAPIAPLVGGKLINYDVLPSNLFGHIEAQGKSYAWNNWAELWTPSSGTEVWATHADQFYAGKSAVLHRKLGKGTVTYIGADSDDAQLEMAILSKLYTQQGVQTQNHADGLVVEWRDGFWIAVNYATQPVEVPIPSSVKILFGSKILKQAEVVVWME